MGKYYLVARNIDDNSHSIIPIESRWYTANGNDIPMRANSLEAIDLVTTRFKSSDEMAKRLCDKGYIKPGNYDFFIVSKYKKHGEAKLRFQEVIYDYKQQRTDYFRKIAYDSLNGNSRSEANRRLFDKFISKMFYNLQYNRVINNHLTYLPYKFVDIFLGIRRFDSVPYNLKYKNSWCLNDYTISRNIVDSFNRFDELSGEDVFERHKRYFKAIEERNKIYNQLMVECDSKFFPGQISLFDTMDDGGNCCSPCESAKGRKSIGVDEKSVVALSIDEKRNFVYKYLQDIGLFAFNVIGDNDFEVSVLEFADSVTSDEAKILTRGLPKKVLSSAYWCNFHKDALHKYGDTLGNYSVLQADIEADKRDLNRALKLPSAVERSYNFCVTYERLKNSILGEGENVYQKS